MGDSLAPIEINPHDRALLDRIGRLRVLAWSTEMPDASTRSTCWLDNFELVARHWCVLSDGEPVASARMSIHTQINHVPDAGVYHRAFVTPPASPMASFNRLVVHPNYRGRGLSGKLDECRLDAARASGCRSVIGETHGASRIRQLRSLGFQFFGPARAYPQHHFVNESGIIFYCDLVALSAGIQTTANRMGWSGEAINEVSQEFIRYAATCGQPVLDIGAAYGVATLPALATGATVYANDLSADHLAELQRATPPEARSRLATVCGRLLPPGWESVEASGRFDLRWRQPKPRSGPWWRFW